MRYRRARTKGGTYFFTVVTYKRNKILCQRNNVSLLQESFRHVMAKHLFAIDAFVLLPDHLHCLWTLPDGDGETQIGNRTKGLGIFGRGIGVGGIGVAS
jgi:putative transposase